MAINTKQQAFVYHYCSNGFNGTQAAISAGYSENCAQQIATENLLKPVIKEEIHKFKANIAETAELTALDLIKELEEARELAKKQGQGSVLVSATMGKAKLMGLDQQVLIHQGPNGGPIETSARVVRVSSRKSNTPK